MEDEASSSGAIECLIPSPCCLENESCHAKCKTSTLDALDSTLSMSEYRRGGCNDKLDPFEILPDHLVVEVLTRVPVANWASAACVRKSWAVFFGGEMLWEAALAKQWPTARNVRRWPGPIQQGSQKRRYIALFVSKSLFSFEDKYGDIDELAGHAYLFLKEQLQVPTPMSYGFLQRTIIDQLLACGEESDIAHKLAAHVWVAVISNLEENEHTFRLLMQMVEEWEAFLPYPYSKSHAVQWRLFERLFTDFRDCLSATDYYSALTRAKDKFEFLPATWLGY